MRLQAPTGARATPVYARTPLKAPDRKPLYAATALLALGLTGAFLSTTELGGSYRKRAGEAIAGISVLPRKEVAEVTRGRMPAFASGGLKGEDPLAGMALEAGFGVILFNGDTFGFDLEVNGQFKPVVNNRIGVPLGVPLRLRARKAGFEDFIYLGRVAAADAPLLLNLKFQPVRAKGYLSVVAATEMKVKIYEGDALVLEGNTPLNEAELAVGDYRLVLESPFLNAPSEEAVRIEAGKRTAIDHSAP